MPVCVWCVCVLRMVFPMQISELPYESMLTFHLLASRQGKTPELLLWAVQPLYSHRLAFYTHEPQIYISTMFTS